MKNPAPRIVLKPRRAQPFFFRHPWVFSGAVDSAPPDLADGSLVEVFTPSGDWIARGFYNSRSQVRVRLFSWRPDEMIDEEFWRRRLRSALDLRRRPRDLDHPAGACRLLYSDSDGFPGLIVDRYREYLVVKWGSLALYQRRELIYRLLIEALAPRGILSRTDGTGARREGLAAEVCWVHGSPAPQPLPVNLGGVQVLADLAGGQKTGLYLDQRENARAAAGLTAEMRVLDAFCYVGTFALTAAAAGAAEVVGLDGSAPAIDLATAAARLNRLPNVHFRTAEVFAELRRLRESGETFDAVFLDPPRFAPSRAALERAARGYRELNLSALRLLRPGGLLVTSSCSQHLAPETFLDIVNRAALEAGRCVRILERRGQPPDHPVVTSCPESGYLKCFICLVD